MLPVMGRPSREDRWIIGVLQNPDFSLVAVCRFDDLAGVLKPYDMIRCCQNFKVFLTIFVPV
jgi:hypothetical protein